MMRVEIPDVECDEYCDDYCTDDCYDQCTVLTKLTKVCFDVSLIEIFSLRIS